MPDLSRGGLFQCRCFKHMHRVPPWVLVAGQRIQLPQVCQRRVFTGESKCMHGLYGGEFFERGRNDPMHSLQCWHVHGPTQGSGVQRVHTREFRAVGGQHLHHLPSWHIHGAGCRHQMPGLPHRAVGLSGIDGMHAM